MLINSRTLVCLFFFLLMHFLSANITFPSGGFGVFFWFWTGDTAGLEKTTCDCQMRLQLFHHAKALAAQDQHACGRSVASRVTWQVRLIPHNTLYNIEIGCGEFGEWFSALNEPFHHIYDPSLCIFYAAPQTWLIDGFARVESSLRRTKTRMKGGWHTGAKWTIFHFMWLRSDFLMTVWTAQDLRRKISFFSFFFFYLRDTLPQMRK